MEMGNKYSIAKIIPLIKKGKAHTMYELWSFSYSIYYTIPSRKWQLSYKNSPALETAFWAPEKRKGISDLVTEIDVNNKELLQTAFVGVLNGVSKLQVSEVLGSYQWFINSYKSTINYK